jgi:hypothetical protein
MELIFAYLGWLVVTTAFTLIRKESKKEAIFRYWFTFISTSVIIVLVWLYNQR